MALIRVMSPVGIALRDACTVPALPDALAGRTVGFLDNTKSNFDRLSAEMGRLLTEQHGVRAIVQGRKANASTPAPAELIADLAKRCDMVFAGSAD